MKNKPTFKNPADVFEKAIKAGRLSRVKQSINYAGSYMYMGTWGGKDTFKNINTRKYDV